MIESGVVASLARPGGNLTGSTGEVDAVEACKKRLQLLREVAPSARRVPFLGQLSAHFKDASIRAPLESASRELGQSSIWVEARKREDFDVAFERIVSGRATALYVDANPAPFANARRIVEFAAARRLPAVYGFREAVEQGGLTSYGVDYENPFRQASGFVEKILKGTLPGRSPSNSRPSSR